MPNNGQGIYPNPIDAPRCQQGKRKPAAAPRNHGAAMRRDSLLREGVVDVRRNDDRYSCWRGVMGLPSRQPHPPTRPSNFPPCPRRRQCRYRTGSGSRRRSPWEGHTCPSIGPPRFSCVRRVSSSPGTGRGGVAGRVRWRGSAGWSCVCSRSRGSSGCHAAPGERLRRASGWARRPTAK